MNIWAKCALLSVPLMLGAALWGVSWRLDHPPQTKADVAFARLVNGADRVEISSCLGHKRAILQEESLHALLSHIHLANASAPSYSSCDSRYTLKFQSKKQELATFDLDFDAMGLERTPAGKSPFNFVLEPRTGAKLERYISELMNRVPSSS